MSQEFLIQLVALLSVIWSVLLFVWVFMDFFGKKVKKMNAVEQEEIYAYLMIDEDGVERLMSFAGEVMVGWGEDFRNKTVSQAQILSNACSREIKLVKFSKRDVLERIFPVRKKK